MQAGEIWLTSELHALAVKNRLELAKMTGRTNTLYAYEAILEHLEGTANLTNPTNL